MNKVNIELGDLVKGKVTGFEGIAIARTEWLNKCVRFGLKSPTLKDGLPRDEQWFDQEQLVLKKKATVIIDKAPTGGPMPDPERCSDPRR